MYAPTTAPTPRDNSALVETGLDAHDELNTPIERLLGNQLDKPSDFGVRQTTLELIMRLGKALVTGAISAGSVSSNLRRASVGIDSLHGYYLHEVLDLEAGLYSPSRFIDSARSRPFARYAGASVVVEMQRPFHLAFSLLNSARIEDADIHEFSDNPLVIAPLSL